MGTQPFNFYQITDHDCVNDQTFMGRLMFGNEADIIQGIAISPGPKVGGYLDEGYITG